MGTRYSAKTQSAINLQSSTVRLTFSRYFSNASLELVAVTVATFGAFIASRIYLNRSSL